MCRDRRNYIPIKRYIDGKDSVSVEKCFMPLRKLTRVYWSRLTFGEQPVSRWITGVQTMVVWTSLVLMVTVAERFKLLRTETSQVDRSLAEEAS